MDSIVKVYVITVNWNRPQDTIECVNSLFTQEKVSLHIVIVDNGSTDDSYNCLSSYYQGINNIEVIKTERNGGFSKGYNYGIRHCLQNEDVSHILIINNDTISSKKMVFNLLKGLNQCPENSIIAPSIYYYDLPEKIWSIGGKISEITMEMVDDHGRNYKEKSFGILERDFLTGCALLLKRSIIERVGLFDEDFFLCYEDRDYCLRAQKSDVRMFVSSESQIFHKVSLSTGGQDSPVERYWMARSGIKFIKKHIEVWQFLPVVFWKIGSIVRISFSLAIKRKKKSLFSYWRGIKDGLFT